MARRGRNEKGDDDEDDDNDDYDGNDIAQSICLTASFLNAHSHPLSS